MRYIYGIQPTHLSSGILVSACVGVDSLLASGFLRMLSSVLPAQGIRWGWEDLYAPLRLSRIYFLGGWDGNTHLNSGEVFDPEENTWTFISPAGTARWDAGVAVDGDKLFIVGGCDRNAVCTLQTECYNTETDTWVNVASLPIATHGLKCCTIRLPSKFV